MTGSTLSKGLLAAIGGFALFSLHDALIKSLAAYSSFQILFFAVLFSHVPFTFYLAAEKQSGNFRPVHPYWVIFRALCMVGSGCFAFFAFSNLPLAQTYALLFSTPFIITLLAIPLLGEQVRLFRWFAILLGLTGVIIALRPGTTTITMGHIAALLAALCSSLSAVTTRKIGAAERGATLVLYPLLANIVVTGSILVFVYQPMPFIDLAKMAAIGGLGMIGQVLIITAYRSASAAVIAPFQYSQMLWAVFYGFIWFKESPDRYILLGTGIIILAGLLIVWRETTRTSSHRPFLKTRNIRVVSAPPMKSVESEESADNETIKKNNRG